MDDDTGAAVARRSAARKAGRKNKRSGGAGAPADADNAHEQAPLLWRGERGSDDESGEDDLGEGEQNGGAEEQALGGADYGFDEWAGLPWYKRPSVYWLLGPFTISSIAIGGIIIPKINLILSLICREYFADKSFHLASGLGELDPQCRTPEVQARVAHFTMWAGLISGVLSALTAPRLCALSDRWGRKPVMMICNAGSLFGEVMTIFAANFPETFPVHWILLGSFIDGICGSMIASSAVVQSYATDCTPPSRRNIIFGQFHGCIFTGIAIGPLVAAGIMKFAGNIIIMFYIALGCHLFFITLLVFFIPESLTKKRQMAAREKHRRSLEARGPSNSWKARIKSLNALEPLKALYPKDPDIPLATRKNLFLLSTIDGIIFGTAMGAMGAVVLYSQYRFQWDVATQSIFMSVVSSARVSCLIIVLPLITYLFRGKASSPNARPAPRTGVDRFELSIIRAAILFDMLGFLGYALARSGEMFIAAGTVASMGGIGSPTLQAALTKHVPPDRIGQLLGALGLLHAIARVAAPVVFNSIYAATVGKFDQAVFIILTTLFGVAWVISWFVRPGVRLPEVEAEYTRREAPVDILDDSLVTA